MDVRLPEGDEDVLLTAWWPIGKSAVPLLLDSSSFANRLVNASNLMKVSCQ